MTAAKDLNGPGLFQCKSTSCGALAVIQELEDLSGVENLPAEADDASVRLVWRCQKCGATWDLHGQPTWRIETEEES